MKKSELRSLIKEVIEETEITPIQAITLYQAVKLKSFGRVKQDADVYDALIKMGLLKPNHAVTDKGKALVSGGSLKTKAREGAAQMVKDGKDVLPINY